MRPFYLSILGLALTTSPTIFATSDSAYSQLESVTVIGTRALTNATIAGTPIKDLPLNAHVVGFDEIKRIKFVDPNELLDRVPGETQVRNLRIPDGGKSYTLPMVDGLPLESPYEGATQRLDRVNTSDIARVEIIKGPSSAIYPNNAIGGIINVITREPPKTAESNLWLEAGNFGRQRAGFSTGGSRDALGYFIDLNTRRIEGLREFSKNNRDQASAKLVYNINNVTRVTTRLEHLDEETNVRGDLTREQLATNPKQAGGLSSSEDLEQQSISARFEQDYEQGLLDAHIQFRVKNTIGASRFRGPQDEEDKGLSSKVLYRHNFNRQLNGKEQAHIIVGFETYQGKQDTLQYERNDIDLNGPFTQFDNQLDIRAYFAQYQMNPIEPLNVTFGTRYESIELESSAFTQTAQFSDFAHKLGVTFDANQHTTLWLNISEGFLAPDLSDLFDINEGNPNLEPEKSINYEIGLRGSYDSITIDTSIYRSILSNYLVTQEFIENGVEIERTTNAGEVNAEGIETVIEYAPNNLNWRLGLTHTYSKNIYNSFVSSDGDFSGNELRRSPRHHLNARLAWLPFEGFLTELEGDFYSSYYSDTANSAEGRFKRGERINLRFTYDINNWSLWLKGLNLTDTLEDRATFSRGTLRFRTSDGRTYYAGVSYQF